VKIKSNVLAWCIEDYTYLLTLNSIVNEFFPKRSDEEMKRATLDIIQLFLDEKLVIAGNTTKDGEFKKWNLSTNNIYIPNKKGVKILKK